MCFNDLLSPMMRHSICEIMEYLVIPPHQPPLHQHPPQLKKMSPIKVQVTQGRRGGAGHTIQKNRDPCYKRDQVLSTDASSQSGQRYTTRFRGQAGPK